MMLVLIGVSLVLVVLGWLATRRLSTPIKIAARLVLVLLAAVPLVLLKLEEHAAPTKTAGLPPAAEQKPPLPRPQSPTDGAAKAPVEPRPPAASAPPPAAPGAPVATRPPAPPQLPSATGTPPPPAADPPKVTSNEPSGGAAPPAPEPEQSRSVKKAKRAGPRGGDAYQVVPVFYGTDRVRIERSEKPTVRTEDDDPAAFVNYTASRAARLELGRAMVTVPKAHQVPAIERPWVYRIPLTNIVVYAEKEDPALHFTLQEVQPLSREEFLALVRERLAASKDFDGHALVFVHGYNTTFDYALYRAAQISYDLGFDGAPFVYSWPSDGAILSYPWDRESAEQAQPYLREFLELVMKDTGAKSVSIIAHSMGNQLLMPVLRELKKQAPDGLRISEVILAAPDVGRDNFAYLAREIRGFARGITLYASATDRALLASRKFWSGPRAGEVPPEGPLVVEGIETIDITALSTEMLGLNHNGFAERSALLTDIGELLKNGARPPDLRESKLQRVEGKPLPYWKYNP